MARQPCARENLCGESVAGLWIPYTSSRSEFYYKPGPDGSELLLCCQDPNSTPLSDIAVAIFITL